MAARQIVRGHAGGVVDVVELRAAPGALEAFNRTAEVLVQRRIVPVDIDAVGDIFGPGTIEQLGLLERVEVFAVDPDQVNGAAVALDAGFGFAQDLVDGVNGVGQGHAIERDVVFFGERNAVGFIDKVVDRVRTAPHVPVDSHAVGGGGYVVPAIESRRRVHHVLRHSRSKCAQDQSDEQECTDYYSFAKHRLSFS